MSNLFLSFVQEGAYMKTPFISLDQAREIAAQYPTPFHLYDEAGIRKRPEIFIRLFPGTRDLKNIMP